MRTYFQIFVDGELDFTSTSMLETFIAFNNVDYEEYKSSFAYIEGNEEDYIALVSTEDFIDFSEVYMDEWSRHQFKQYLKENNLMENNKTDPLKPREWTHAFAESYNKDIDEDNMTNEQSMLGKTAINPDHYRDVIPGYQYMQLMEYLLEGKDGITAHLLGQVYKYAMRLGNKDSMEQDAEKIAWYAVCLAHYLKTDIVPIDIEINKAIPKKFGGEK